MPMMCTNLTNKVSMSICGRSCRACLALEAVPACAGTRAPAFEEVLPGVLKPYEGILSTVCSCTVAAAGLLKFNTVGAFCMHDRGCTPANPHRGTSLTHAGYPKHRSLLDHTTLSRHRSSAHPMSSVVRFPFRGPPAATCQAAATCRLRCRAHLSPVTHPLPMKTPASNT